MVSDAAAGPHSEETAMDRNNPQSTLAPGAIEEAERSAYNAAFWQLGLPWRWDAATYRELSGIASEQERIRTYVELHQPHLLKAYDIAFLCNMIDQCKTCPAEQKNAFSVNCGTLH
jgi:hypothetical protein